MQTAKFDPSSCREEHDSLGTVLVPKDALWAAQTERSRQNFPIGGELMPPEIITAFAHIKAAAATTNERLGTLDSKRAHLIVQAAQEVLEGKHDSEFPLVVWQTGSGTQSNMNMNEVLATRANQLAGTTLVHPNDHVNCSQSSNDTFPTALNIALVSAISERVVPEAKALIGRFKELEESYPDLIKCGRTHLQDAVPLGFAQEVSGWRGLVENAVAELERALEPLYKLALGGTAVGTGLNAPYGFATGVAAELAQQTGYPFVSDPNKFAALSGKDAVVFAHGALKALAANLMKIANDIRWLASGPRCGLGELTLPANEPGSSIMPGKVNPTQCEALTMVAVQVMGNDAAVGIAASQGNFELNVFMPVIAYNALQSCRLLADAMASFGQRCVAGLTPNADRMRHNVERSLMLVTRLSPSLGYERAAHIAHLAHEQNLSLKEACLLDGALDEKSFDALVRPEEMI